MQLVASSAGRPCKSLSLAVIHPMVTRRGEASLLQTDSFDDTKLPNTSLFSILLSPSIKAMALT